MRLHVNFAVLEADSPAYGKKHLTFPMADTERRTQPVVPAAAEGTASRSPPTDYSAFVLQMLSRMTRSPGSIDQRVLRQCLALSSSYLITDSTMHPSRGLTTWHTGFSRLIDILVALHARGELELDTVNEASKACSECWTVAGAWREMEGGRESVKGVAARLKGLLDENGKTYRGGRVYVP